MAKFLCVIVLLMALFAFLIWQRNRLLRRGHRGED
jgi:hypothetical protein